MSEENIINDMKSKKARAIVLGATGNLSFALANVILGIKKHSPSLLNRSVASTDFIVFYNDISENDQILINSIIPCKFIHYEMPINTSKVETSSFPRYSKLAFSRYECFRMLDKYEKVLWIDVDILIQKDISGIFEFAKTGISLYKEEISLQECFSKPIDGYEMDGGHYNSGVLLLSDSLPDYGNKANWLYTKTYELGEHLKYADQGIINLLLQEFNLESDNLPEEFNCHPRKKAVKLAKIVHTYSPQKFWSWYEPMYSFREWDLNYKKWLKMGGSAFCGKTYRATERWAKRIHHDAPDPLRHPSKFLKFLLTVMH